ncbi:Per1-like protein [Epithele typhae]|uniref:Per1-like protein n=1 Tax=Epithele typhae TaxID=378194 RepID=UPI0020085603|nr:Per1-like protein [Epithele typhae]KAH9918343.1 Per1-like protein [Epithele typhae]
MRLPALSLLLLCLTRSPAVLASSGDRAQGFRDCVSTCERQLCPASSPIPLSFALRLTRWTCTDDCKYRCMHMVTDAAIKHGAPVEQYYGKWPFWRLAGMQEPASVLFSVFNFVAHFNGARKILRRVPDGHPMKKFYLVFALASMNAWVWSSVFHTRDLPTTEKLDYFSAALAILYALYYTVIRLFHLYPTTTTIAHSPRSGTHVLWTLLCTIAFLAHISYLSLLPRFDYAYNIAFNLAVGMTHNLLWLGYALPASAPLVRRFPGQARGYRPRHAYKPAALELFDFPPWARAVDAHALWHLATVPIAVYWYDFLVEDALDDGWRVKQ